MANGNNILHQLDNFVYQILVMIILTLFCIIKQAENIYNDEEDSDDVADEDLEVAVEADDAPNDDEMVREITGSKNELFIKQDTLSNQCPCVSCTYIVYFYFSRVRRGNTERRAAIVAQS